jgi:hypothetical protein
MGELLIWLQLPARAYWRVLFDGWKRPGLRVMRLLGAAGDVLFDAPPRSLLAPLGGLNFILFPKSSQQNELSLISVIIFAFQI